MHWNTGDRRTASQGGVVGDVNKHYSDRLLCRGTREFAGEGKSTARNIAVRTARAAAALTKPTDAKVLASISATDKPLIHSNRGPRWLRG